MKEWKDMTIDERKIEVRKTGLFYHVAPPIRGADNVKATPELVRRIIEENLDQIVSDKEE